ncbi:HD domain-containing protein [Bacillus thuringiensis]|uniref:HD domain-containing protein n=1 Tax=Bacillus thuringiensis TaxID=1428 RepID=UPI003985C453
MKTETIIKETENFVRSILEKDSSGHDWWHIYRVRNLAIKLAQKEGADLFICEMAALLHDVADEKLISDETKGINLITNWLKQHDIRENIIRHIISIISEMSFKGGNRKPMETMEGKIVQDADRLDAIGAIGIARTFAYAGTKGNLMYDPMLSPRVNMTKEEYRNGKSTAINHFYEKLLKLKDLMNTEYAKEIALERHKIMEEYLKDFFVEWDGLDEILIKKLID